MSLLHRLRDDDSGAMMVLGLFMATFLIGGLYYIAGVGEAIWYREMMQDATDAGSFTASVMHARGMNTIVFLNLLMVVALAIYFILKVIETILITVAAILGIAAVFPTPLSPALISASTAVRSVSVSLNRVNETYRRAINPVFKSIGVGQEAIRLGWPALGLIRGSELSMRSELYQPVNAGFVAPGFQGTTPQFFLPVQDGDFKDTCDRAKRYAFNPITDPFRRLVNVSGLDFDFEIPPPPLNGLWSFKFNPGEKIMDAVESSASALLTLVSAPVCMAPGQELEDVLDQARRDSNLDEITQHFIYPLFHEQRQIAMGCLPDDLCEGDICDDNDLLYVTSSVDECAPCGHAPETCETELQGLQDAVYAANCDRLPRATEGHYLGDAPADAPSCDDRTAAFQSAAAQNNSGCEGAGDPSLCRRSVDKIFERTDMCKPDDGGRRGGIIGIGSTDHQATGSASMMVKSAVVLFHQNQRSVSTSDPCEIRSTVWIPRGDQPTPGCGGEPAVTEVLTGQQEICPEGISWSQGTHDVTPPNGVLTNLTAPYYSNAGAGTVRSYCHPWRETRASLGGDAYPWNRWTDFYGPIEAYAPDARPAGIAPIQTVFGMPTPPAASSDEYAAVCNSLPVSFTEARNMYAGALSCSAHFYSYVVKFVPEIYSCVKERDYKLPADRVAVADQDEVDLVKQSGANNPPLVLADDMYIGDGAFQLRGFALGEAVAADGAGDASPTSRHTQAERVIRNVSGDGSEVDTYSDEAATLGRFSFAQSEYFFMIDYPGGNTATKFEPDVTRDLGSIGSREDLRVEAMWHMNWQARLRRFGLVETNVDFGGICTSAEEASDDGNGLKAKLAGYVEGVCSTAENVVTFGANAWSVH